MFKKKPAVDTDPKKIEEILTRGVDSVYPNQEWLRRELSSGRRLKIYTGWDPTGTQVHIGHTVWMWKLRALQDLGHEIIVLQGGFTAMIGDPSGKTKTRKPLTKEEVKRNIEGFEEKVARIFNNQENPITILNNNKWLSKMSFTEVIELSSNFTVQQMLERDMFEKRIKEEKPIGLHEFLYPLMQGYDSVEMGIDLEIGGTDQTFNMLAGRTLLKKLKGKEKGVMTLHILADASGKKIGKTEGNAIEINLPPEDLFGLIMTLPDSVIWTTFEACTNLTLERIQEYKDRLETDPRQAKAKLAWELVRIYNNVEAANKAEQHFTDVFKNKKNPEGMLEVKIKPDQTILDILVENKLCSSKSDARRTIDQNGVKLNGKPVTIHETPAVAGVLQKGKRHFLKLYK